MGSTAAAEHEIATARRDFAVCGASPTWFTPLTGVPLSEASCRRLSTVLLAREVGLLRGTTM